MNISKRDINLLLVLGGLIIFMGLYYLYGNLMNGKTEVIQAKIVELQPDYDQLQEHIIKEPTYKKGIENAKAYLSETVSSYPSKVPADDYMSWTLDWRDSNDLSLLSMTINPAAIVKEFPGYVQNPDNSEEFMPVDMSAQVVTASAMTSNDYSQMKRAIDGFFTDHTTLDVLTVNYDSTTGLLNSVFDMSKYVLNWQDAPYYELPVPVTQKGQPKLFKSGIIE